VKWLITSVLTVANHHSYETATLIPVPVSTSLTRYDNRVRCFIHRLISPMHQTCIRLFKSDATAKSTGE